jgi:hypothetical protein
MKFTVTNRVTGEVVHTLEVANTFAAKDAAILYLLGKNYPYEALQDFVIQRERTKVELMQSEWTWNRITARDRIKLLVSVDKAILGALRSWNDLPASTKDAFMTIDWNDVFAGPGKRYRKPAILEAEMRRTAERLRGNGYTISAEALDSLSKDYRTLADANR